ncbi:MAG: CotH kinase family protein [Alistipes indistinctus]
MLYAPDFPAAGEYAELLDTDSFIDWWIVQELTHNQDTRLPGSCCMNKDRLGKLKAGPVWDFDLTTFIDSRSFLLKDESANNHSWFPGSSATRPSGSASGSAGRRSGLLWSRFPPSSTAKPPTSRKRRGRTGVCGNTKSPARTSTTTRSFRGDDAVAALQTNYANRLAWMDAQIAAL